MYSLGFGVDGSVLRVWGLAFEEQGLGCGVLNLGLGLEFGV